MALEHKVLGLNHKIPISQTRNVSIKMKLCLSFQNIDGLNINFRLIVNMKLQIFTAGFVICIHDVFNSTLKI